MDLARVTVLPDPEAGPLTADGPVRSIQEAEVVLPVARYRELRNAAYLERLAQAYWAHLTRVSRGLIRVVYQPDAHIVVLLSRRLPLLRFAQPDYATDARGGSVTWRIERGLLVAKRGRRSGMFRISVRRGDSASPAGSAALRVRTEVSNFYPFIRGDRWFARLGTRIYSATQLRIHVLVTKGFLRSLAGLDLPPSAGGAFAANEAG
jgi:hypothetical protein